MWLLSYDVNVKDDTGNCVNEMEQRQLTYILGTMKGTYLQSITNLRAAEASTIIYPLTSNPPGRRTIKRLFPRGWRTGGG